ncbi:MAG: phosphatidylserine decarboxylase [Planctomycetes bacterium]|nr:phosphatidylserine decarboxylase [Planctomycetota bacterium]
MPEVVIRDRRSGASFPEKVFSEAELRYLYGPPAGRLLERVLVSAAPVSVLYGLLQRAPWSRRRVRGFVERLGIDASEAERPLDDYPTLDAFFTRRLRPGVRPVDPTPSHLVSPADGRVLVYPEVAPGAGLAVKGSRVALAHLVGDAALARRYAGGAAAVVRLAPADYHRFHFPLDGQATPWRGVGRRLHSVHPIALAAAAPSLRNKRAISALVAPEWGAVLIVEVGAMLVGTIVQTYRPGPVARGQEKGYFRFGGSTVVLLLEPGRVRWDDDLVASSRDGVETLVTMGSRIGARP